MADRSVSHLPPGVREKPTSLRVPEREITRPTPTLGSGQIIAQLRANIRSGKLCSDAMLQEIVEAARAVTRAHGAAIAMRRNNLVICTARAGQMAPELWSLLNAESGISGQCLQTGAALRCDDTHADKRVDSEVCRRLGLRSLAVAPIGKTPAVSGVLEAFSAKPFAFNDSAVRLLVELAELVTATERYPTQSAALEFQRNLLGTTRSKGKLIVAATAVLAFITWLAFGGKEVLSNLLTPRQASAVRLADQPSALRARPILSPGVSVRNAKASLSRGLVMASTTEKTRPRESLIARETQPEAASDSNAATTAPGAYLRLSVSQSPGDAAATPPPLPVVSSGADTVLAKVLSPSDVFPVRATAKLSQGVSGGTIERQVNPTYPPEALGLKLEGRVLLKAVVTEQGTVLDLTVINGHPLLARAAMNAVAQWRYRPYRLNGEPVRATTEITVIFKLR